FVVFAVFIDGPQVIFISPGDDVASRKHGSHHGVVLVVIFVHTVAADEVQVRGKGGESLADEVYVLAVVVVVDGIRFGLANDAAVHDVGGDAQANLFDFLLGQCF